MSVVQRHTNLEVVVELVLLFGVVAILTCMKGVCLELHIQHLCKVEHDHHGQLVGGVCLPHQLVALALQASDNGYATDISAWQDFENLPVSNYSGVWATSLSCSSSGSAVATWFSLSMWKSAVQKG